MCNLSQQKRNHWLAALIFKIIIVNTKLSKNITLHTLISVLLGHEIAVLFLILLYMNNSNALELIKEHNQNFTSIGVSHDW